MANEKNEENKRFYQKYNNPPLSLPPGYHGNMTHTVPLLLVTMVT